MLKGIVRADGWLQSTADALGEAASLGSVDGYPFTILSKMLKSYHSTGPTASTIASTTWRRSVLENIVDYYARPEALWPMLRGTLVHTGLEGNIATGEKLIKEKRLTAAMPDYRDITLSGQIDLYYPAYGRLEDYKTCMSIPNFIKDEHAFQLAMYWWLLRWAGYVPQSAVIDYISWTELRQVGVISQARGFVPVVQHPMFTEEKAFQDRVAYGYRILDAGYTHNRVPSMSDCNNNYCRNCPVKQACDKIAVVGETIYPEAYEQKGN
jgi:hypothetical protein